MCIHFMLVSSETVFYLCVPLITITSYLGRYATSNRKIADGRELRVLVHTRNIRAVLFHPDGDYVFTAAPDPPRQSQPAFTPCRLYAFTFDDIGNFSFFI